jgi:hypothetical protein
MRHERARRDRAHNGGAEGAGMIALCVLLVVALLAIVFDL